MNLTNSAGWVERKRSLTYPRAGLLLVLLLTGFGHPAQAANPDIPAYIEFDLRLLGFTIAATRISYSIDPEKNYHYQTTSVPAGLFGWVGDYQILDKSTGIIRDGVLIPHHYEFRHTLNDKPRDITLDFDWKAKRVTGTARKYTVDLPLLAGMQDQLSVQPSLIHALRNHKTDIAYDVIERHKKKHYKFRIMGEETIDTVFGHLDTVRVQILKNGKPGNTTLWCAPTLGYLPVQGEHIEKGFHYKLVARKVAPYSAQNTYHKVKNPHPAAIIIEPFENDDQF